MIIDQHHLRDVKSVLNFQVRFEIFLYLLLISNIYSSIEISPQISQMLLLMWQQIYSTRSCGFRNALIFIGAWNFEKNGVVVQKVKQTPNSCNLFPYWEAIFISSLVLPFLNCTESVCFFFFFWYVFGSMLSWKTLICCYFWMGFVPKYFVCQSFVCMSKL